MSCTDNSIIYVRFPQYIYKNPFVKMYEWSFSSPPINHTALLSDCVSTLVIDFNYRYDVAITH